MKAFNILFIKSHWADIQNQDTVHVEEWIGVFVMFYPASCPNSIHIIIMVQLRKN